MVKKKCGTCRFFQDAGIACSGWCTHPERGELHDLVLVRRAELACRNSWDRDLWEVAKARRTVMPVSGAEERVPPPRQRTPDNPTDRVTSIDIARPAGQQESRAMPPAVAGGQESRIASDAPRSEDRHSTPSQRKRADVSSLEPSFQRALRVKSSPVEDRDARETDDRSAPIVVGSRQRIPEPPAPRALQSVNGARPRSEPAGDTAPLPVEEVNAALSSQAGAPDTTSPYGLWNDQRPEVDQIAPIIHVDGLTLETSAARPQFADQTMGSASTARSVSPLDETPWAAAIPRCCDTCREFQRDASGQAGYCGSPYAFGRRTMVKSDELACRSSIGVWWLPSDDTWLDRADVSHHTRPTPYLDAALADIGSGSR